MNLIVIALVAGNYFSCALTSQSQVQCWGDGSRNQLDIPQVKDQIVELVAGGYHACLRTASEVRCWGDNTWKELDVPERVQKNALKIDHFAASATAKSTCVVYRDRTVDCWGDNRSGQISIRNSDLQDHLVASDLALGANHTCFIDKNASPKLQCIGQNIAKESSVPEDLNAPDIEVLRVVAGSMHTCAVFKKSDSPAKLRCWGSNKQGQLDLTASIKNPSIIAAGAGNTCTYEPEAKRAHCWGWNSFGQSDISEDIKTPTAIALGVVHGCALQSGKVKCWGSNDQRQLEIPKSIAE